MYRAYRTTRWLVTANVIVSLGLTGLFPQMVTLAGQDVRVELEEKPTTCCCGTEDGRCCGMGCCVARRSPAKEQCPCPSKSETRNGQSNLFAIVVFRSLLFSDKTKLGLQFSTLFSDANHFMAGSSLQALHARIDA
ncbi:hypothetical protein MNBD_PLANCTO02-594 [hydrothermal vent metagenome]|uniref:Uncharacterized protein n=1 Tax=hydrothermal vent metagenome TaxID=652676 RepID=A0A3B1DB64_9ZZZZ